MLPPGRCPDMAATPEPIIVPFDFGHASLLLRLSIGDWRLAIAH